MSQLILEKSAMVSEGIADTIEKTFFRDPSLKKYYNRLLKPDVEGYTKYAPELSKVAILQGYEDALRRGAGPGAAMGAVGGAGIGAGLSGRGIASTLAKGKGARGKALALIGNLLTKGAGATVGAISGGGAGWAGGRQTGATLLGGGAGALTGGLAAQPLAILLATLGAGGGAKLMKALKKAQSDLTSGGPEGQIFRA